MKSYTYIKTFNNENSGEDCTYICYDENWTSQFFDTPIYKTAAAKAIALKDQASEDEMNNFKSCLQEQDDQETLNAL